MDAYTRSDVSSRVLRRYDQIASHFPRASVTAQRLAATNQMSKIGELNNRNTHSPS
jgi:hypothetical protein